VNLQDMAFIACEPGKLLVEILAPAFPRPPVEAFVEAVQSLESVAINSFKKMKDGVLLEYDERSIDAQDLKAFLAAAYSTVTYDSGKHCPATHILPVTFGGQAGPDLAVAGVLLGTSENTLIRRICRSRHTVRMFSEPGASALLELPWSDGGLQTVQASRCKRAVPPGSLTLSGAGLTIASRAAYSDELIIGRVTERSVGTAALLRMGDHMWLRGRLDSSSMLTSVR
jgi:allophanate hydrolase subunit 1